MNQQPSERGGFHIRSYANRSSGDCHTVDQSIDEYVLGILEPSQCAAIERHLVRCAHCSAIVASYRQTTAALALAVPQAMPPASARTALMSRIAETPRTIAPSRSLHASGLDVLRTPTLPASTPVSPLPDRPQDDPAWWRVYAAPLATLPLLLAIGLVAAWGMNNYTQLHNSNDALAQRDLQIARLSTQLSNENSQGVANLLVSNSAKRYTLAPEVSGAGDNAQGMNNYTQLHSSNNALAQRDLQIARLSTQLSNENSQGVANLLVSNSAKRYTLAPEVSGAGDNAQGILIADPGSQQAALKVNGLPAGTYTVVVQMENGQMVPKTEFEVNNTGSATTLVDLGSAVTDLKSVHIRPTITMTESDVAVGQVSDVLMTMIGPDISNDADTSVQKP